MWLTAGSTAFCCAIRLPAADERVDASWVINCSGPWADRVCQRSSIRMAKPMLGGVRGSHIVLPRFSGLAECRDLYGGGRRASDFRSSLE